MKPVFYDPKENTNRGPSPGIWGSCDWIGMMADPRRGKVIWDDFDAWHLTGINYAIDESDDQASVAQLANDHYGVVQLIIVQDDNEETWFQSVLPWCQIDLDDTVYRRMWFEARVKQSLVATDKSFFVGLMSVLAAGDSAVQDDDTGAIAIAAESYCGFRALCADGDGLDAVYGTAAGTETVLLESASGPTCMTLTADTYVKVGITYDPQDDYVRYFVDGGEVAKVDSETSGFPDNVDLYFTLANKVGSNAALTTSIDWVRCAQEYA